MNLDYKRLYTAKETAAMLNCSEAALRLWRRQGRGPKSVKLGRRLVRYDARSILEFLEINTSGKSK